MKRVNWTRTEPGVKPPKQEQLKKDLPYLSNQLISAPGAPRSCRFAVVPNASVGCVSVHSSHSSPCLLLRGKSHWVSPKESVPAGLLWLALILSQTRGILLCHKLLEVQTGCILHNGFVPETNNPTRHSGTKEQRLSWLTQERGVVARGDGKQVRPPEAGTGSKVAL